MLPLMTLTTTVLSPLVTPSPNGSVGTEIANEPLLVVVALCTRVSLESARKNTSTAIGPLTVLLASTASITLPLMANACPAVTSAGMLAISTKLDTCTVRLTMLSLPSHLPASATVRLSDLSSGACTRMV